jgi:SAM-dependent methyltransferase
MILVGETHGELQLGNLLSSLGLNRNVQHIDYAPIEAFNGYLAACDGILNLRFPTVGETSGTLLRSLGMGKPILVSEIGAFAEYPDDVCLKVPVDASEEEHIFQYLDLLISRPAVAQALGTRARDWVARECNWPSVASRYVDFMTAVANGAAVSSELPTVAEPVLATPEPVLAEYILSWTKEEDGTRKYAETHRTRLEKTLAVTPRGGPEDRILEMGAYLQITPALNTKLGYGEVRGCYFGTLGKVDERTVTSEDGEEFTCLVDHFDAEKDRFPYEDGSFATVLCCELVEHLPSDPMHMMSEIHRILRPGGHLVLSTPNVVSMRALAGILQGYHPMLFPAYIRPNPGGEADPRHAREYAPREMLLLFENSGFEVTLLDTGPFLAEPSADLGWVSHLLQRYILTQDLRGDGIYVLGRKIGPVRERYPAWLYS